MRSPKLLIVSATLLACTGVAGSSFADNTTATPTPMPSTTPTPMPAPATSTTFTPPSTPPTSTTTTPTTTVPTSTTTTTSAEDVSAQAPTPPLQPNVEPAHESVVVYQHQRPSKALLITGGAVLAGTYATTAALAAANGPIGDKDLYIPIAGPWINLANRSCAGDCPNQTRDTVLIAGSGVLQGVGALMILGSFLIPEKVPAARIQAGPVKMQVVPTGVAAGGGVGAFGTF